METANPINTLHDLLEFDACRFSSAEVQLRNSLSEWIKSANSLQLKAVMQKYLDFVNDHLTKLEMFSEDERFRSVSLKNRIMQAFIEETNEKLNECKLIEVRDACLLASLQSISHYKISIYGTAAAFANSLGKQNAAAIFHEAEINEKHIDDRLSQLAEFEINNRAMTTISLPE